MRQNSTSEIGESQKGQDAASLVAGYDSLELTRAFVLSITFAACTYEAPHPQEIERLVHMTPGGLERWLAVSVFHLSYVAPQRISRRHIRTYGALVAKRIFLANLRADDDMLDVLCYWIELTKQRQRTFRCAATMILFWAIYELLTLATNDSAGRHMQQSLAIAHYVWRPALRRACRDVDIHLRAFALRVAASCFPLARDSLWCTSSAKLLIKAAGARPVTVKSEALKQMVYLSRELNVSFEHIAIVDTWVAVLALHAMYPPARVRNCRALALAGLMALCKRGIPLKQDATRRILTRCVQDKDCQLAIVSAIELFCQDHDSEDRYEEVVGILAEHGGNYLGTLGEAMGKALGPTCSARYVERLEDHIPYEADDLKRGRRLRILRGFAETLSDEFILKLAAALRSASPDTEETTWHLRRLVSLLNNARHVEYAQAVLGLHAASYHD